MVQLPVLGNGEDTAGKHSAAGIGSCIICCHTFVSWAGSQLLKRFNRVARKILSGYSSLRTKSHSLFLCDRLNHCFLPQTCSKHLSLRGLAYIQYLSRRHSPAHSSMTMRSPFQWHWVPQLWLIHVFPRSPSLTWDLQELGSAHLIAINITISLCWCSLKSAFRYQLYCIDYLVQVISHKWNVFWVWSLVLGPISH